MNFIMDMRAKRRRVGRIVERRALQRGGHRAWSLMQSLTASRYAFGAESPGQR